MSKPLIATVIGDPSGIGPEVCVRSLATGALQSVGDYVLIGSLDALEDAAKIAGADVTFRKVGSAAEARGANGGAIAVLDNGTLARGDYTIGKPGANNGRAVYSWMRTGFDLVNAKDAEGIVIASIDSTSLKMAGISVKADMDPEGVWLLRCTGKLRTIPIAEHVLMREVPPMVKKALVLEVILLIGEQMKRWGFANPTIAVAGLNPHCIGEEDAQEIAPAVEAAKERGFDVTGPLSPDTVFRHGLSGRFDVIVTMYHDQGQIAVKTVGLEDACTVFVGLPYVRVGIPHGSAMDIAGTGKAEPRTAATALRTAASLAAGKALAV
jgi:4-phospho-D-threonate 3-dehydrogenase / 4-phospho-D-erythronate 3-dehydrogenase